MQRAGLLVCICVAAALAGCGGRRGSDPRDDSMVVQERPDGSQIAVRPGRDPNAGYIRALEFKERGDCASALVLLRPIAAFGPGYENAQTALGECLLEREDERAEGVTWITRAADAGWPEAQASLAGYFGRIAPSRNAEEAAYWLALYDLNPSKARIGFRAPMAGVLSGIRGSLTEAELAAGRKRAASWQRKLWIPPAAPEGPGLKPEERGRGGFRQPQRPR